MRYETYRKSRQKKHKEPTQEILKAAEQVNGTVIIEWVKAHEAEVEEDNCIRQMKTSGNNMADEEAKRVVQQGIVSSDEKVFSGPWALCDKDTSLPMYWYALPKAVLLLCKKQRQQRLREPTKACLNMDRGNTTQRHYRTGR